MIAEFYGGPDDGGALAINEPTLEYTTHSEGSYFVTDPDGVRTLVIGCELKNRYHLIAVKCGVATYKFVRTEK